jgi:hypothetical protein
MLRILRPAIYGATEKFYPQKLANGISQCCLSLPLSVYWRLNACLNRTRNSPSSINAFGTGMASRSFREYVAR